MRDVRAAAVHADGHAVLHGQVQVRDGGGVELALSVRHAHALHAGRAVAHRDAVGGEVELGVTLLVWVDAGWAFFVVLGG